VPAVCILLCSKLKEAGRNEAADEYLQRALAFHQVCKQVWSWRDLYLRVARDLVCTPGFEHMLEEYAKECLDTPTTFTPARPGVKQRKVRLKVNASIHMVLAIADSYRENYDSAITHLLTTLDPDLDPSKEAFMYDGAFLPSIEAARMRLLENLLKGGKLSEKQITKLKTAWPQKVETILRTLDNN
jgi:hypothetical protein